MTIPFPHKSTLDWTGGGKKYTTATCHEVLLRVHFSRQEKIWWKNVSLALFTASMLHVCSFRKPYTSHKASGAFNVLHQSPGQSMFNSKWDFGEDSLFFRKSHLVNGVNCSLHYSGHFGPHTHFPANTHTPTSSTLPTRHWDFIQV